MSRAILPSWRIGPTRAAILEFVHRVTTEGSPDFVPKPERIATFDNDGTLWCEQPLQVQVFFAQERLRQLAIQYPALAERQPFKAFLEHDLATIHDHGKQGVFEVAFETHAGMTIEEFLTIAGAWLSTARHPKLDRLFARCTYQPQLELLAFLRSRGFKTFIVSGGGVDFIRSISMQAYGIPPEQVIGSCLRLRYEMRDDEAVLIKEAELDKFDDREVKAQNIALHIGQRPILAFGNSDGDLAMLRYCRSGHGARLALLLHHDDDEREFAYDRDFRLSPLIEALDKAESYGITVVSMKEAWKRVFVPAEPKPERPRRPRVRHRYGAEAVPIGGLTAAPIPRSHPGERRGP